MNGLYDYFFINFMKPISPQLLDDFALEMAKTNQAYKICRVQSHYLNYQVIAPNFYVIPNGKENFRSLYTGNEEANVIDHMATGLFSLIKSTGKVPYVRVSNG